MLTQLDSGFLDANTTLVSLSIGGNDIKFGPIFLTCIVAAATPLPCSAVPIVSSGDTVGAEQATKNRVQNEVPNSVATILTEIHKKAPNAKIVLMGYPELFQSGSGCVFIDDLQRGWLNEVAFLLATAMQDGVAAYQAANPGAPTSTFANPMLAFDGHNLCTSNSYVNGMITQLTPGDTYAVKVPLSGAEVGLSMQSFHPNKEGTTAYAGVFNQALQTIRYR